MRIVERDESKLKLSTGHDDLKPVYGFAGFIFLIGLCLLALFLKGLFQEWDAGFLRAEDWSRVAGAVFFSGMFLVLGFLMLAGNPAQECVFDKRSGNLSIVSRPIWRLFLPETHTYSLREITEIVLYEGGLRELSAAIVLASGKRVLLTPAFKGKPAVAHAAQNLCEFLNIPMQINLGMERILKVPAGLSTAARLVPLTCAKCGGRLPAITREKDDVWCVSCGTNLRVVWERKKEAGGE
jgi:hypothetical protein